MESECDCFDLDKVFKRFKIVEFPISFVGLSTTEDLDVEVDLNKTTYFKTLYEGVLMDFEDAREISAAHRAFEISHLNDHTIQITFKPLNECISRAIKYRTNLDNRFVFDLRLINVEGTRCCNRQYHSEIGRYYISGQYEFCKISHSPKLLSFGNVPLKSTAIRYVRIRNDSIVPAKMSYMKATGFEVTPQKFTILPKSSKKILITLIPHSLQVGNTLIFNIRNFHDLFVEPMSYDLKTMTNDNFIRYMIATETNVIYAPIQRELQIESLHKIYEKNPYHTYMNEELDKRKERNIIALQFLQLSKLTHEKPIKPRVITGNDQCCYELKLEERIPGTNICKKLRHKITAHELFDILLNPLTIKFGRVAVKTYGESELSITNNTEYDVTIHLLRDKYIVYTQEKLTHYIIKLKPFSKAIVTILCRAFIDGNFKNTFEYSVNNVFFLNHSYVLEAGNPKLRLQETNLKFGMVTSESFITSVPVVIHNEFNIPVDFEWSELNPDTPFEVIPTSGTVPKHSSKVCDILYVCRATKTKTHEIDFVSKGPINKVIAIEAVIMSRKLSIKFLQSSVVFKDIALNLETIEIARLENSSREIALFYIMEPLIPGITIQPMNGIMRPKTIITFEIIAKFSCVLEFVFDIIVKINNKENLILPISGNVVEPKLNIHPKHIYMPRIPCELVTYVPVTFQNTSLLRAIVEVLDTGDENIFKVYTANGNEKERAFKFVVEGGQSKVVFVKVYDVFRREYEMYLPFKINGLLGPPDHNSASTELHYYIGEYENDYENNPRVKVKSVNKDISYCRISGVITVSWLQLSQEKFEIDYVPTGLNTIDFTMTNISRYYLHVTIVTAKIAPNFSLNLTTEDHQSIINENHIKFELDLRMSSTFAVHFHPKGHGKFVATALLFLDKYMTIPYYNLTFVGRRQAPLIVPSVNRIIFPPCLVETNVSRVMTLKMEIDLKTETNLDAFTCSSKAEPNLQVSITQCDVIEEGEQMFAVVTVTVAVSCRVAYSRQMTLNFHHTCGSCCDIQVVFCFTYCPLTLHTLPFVSPEHNPYPYYPQNSQPELYDYMETCTSFLEKWMFQQGFRRDLYPEIPDTFHAISCSITTAPKGKGINVSYLNFMRRIAGPLMKHVRKISVHGIEESFKMVKEIYDTYREIVHLLRSRGANVCFLHAKYLLSHDQFITFAEHVADKCNADIIFTRELIADEDLFNRLNKQCWLDFILQSYKVFVMDSCFFDCVCVSSQPRDINKILVNWYNEQISLCQNRFHTNGKHVKHISNLTSDLSDGTAIISAFITHCSFLEEHFSIFCEVHEKDKEGDTINNACLIIEAMNQLKLYFPLTSKDFLQPNFLQMLFLSIHLYVTLPMFNSKDTIEFSPPLLRSSTRQLGISPINQETIMFNYTTLNYKGNNFTIEKGPAGENGKKVFVSVKYTANFIATEKALLLLYGYNKTRIFDTYIIFNLIGSVGSLVPIKKCKVTGPLYRPNKVDILVSSPFTTTAVFQVYLTDTEPSIPLELENNTKRKFYVKRLNLIDREINLTGVISESPQDVLEHKLYLQLICLSTQVGNTWIWFKSEVGEFFVKITTQPRWDLAVDTIQCKVHSWPLNPCSCGEACECYRTTILMIPHRNELMLKALRYALLENASEAMMKIYDELIESTTGQIILTMLLSEGGTNISEVQHILRKEKGYRITSRVLLPRIDRCTFSQHTDSVLALPVTIPPNDKSEKYSVSFTSDCGMDIRTYRIFFIEDNTLADTGKLCSPY